MDLKYDKFTYPMVDEGYVKSWLFASVSGSHAFGWTTPKSDLDLRIVTVPHIGQMVSPFFKAVNQESKYKDIDIAHFPIDSFLQLLAKGNGNVLDNLFEHHLIERKSSVDSLKGIVKDSLHKGFLGHCYGYSLSLAKDLVNPTRLNKYGMAKLLLCRYRVLHQGLLLDKRVIEHNLPKILSIQENEFNIETPMLILDKYVKGEQIEPKIFGEALLETNDLQNVLEEVIKESTLPPRHLSHIEVMLDSWIKRLYLGTVKGQKDILGES